MAHDTGDRITQAAVMSETPARTVHVDRVITLEVDGLVALRCPGCDAEQLTQMEPTDAFLDVMQAFVEDHVVCEGTTSLDGLPRQAFASPAEGPSTPQQQRR